MTNSITKYQADKIGNAIIYLGDNVSELSKTKLLKLLFLLEEKSINDYGNPFFGIDFKIWQFGPVAKPIYDGLTTNIESNFLSQYIIKNTYDEYEGIVDFSDDEFSNNDISVMDWAVNFARHKLAEDLVRYTHSKESLWRRGAIKHNVYERFLRKELSTTDFNIDFTLLFEGNTKGFFLLDIYKSALENIEFSSRYKEHIIV